MGLMSWLFGKEEEDSPAEPLVLGALLECDYGERQTFLNLETDNININALPQACVEDAKAHVNIMPFGRCMKNDDCFFKLAPDEKWINTEPQSARVNGKEIITTKSNLICKATGMTIRPVTSGQDGKFARFLIFVRNMDLKYPGLREILEDPYGSLYLEGKYEAALQFLEDQMKSQDGCIELITLYDSENLEGEYMLAALERLMVDCDVRSFEGFMDDLANTALENDVEGMEGWDKNYLNGDMLKLLRIDCKKTEELIKTSPMHRAMEEHKMFSNWLRESTNALAYTLVIYASERAMENISDKGLKETETETMQRNMAQKANDKTKKSENLSAQIKGTSYDINKLEKTQPYTYPENVASIKEAIVQNGPDAVPPIEIRVDHGRVFVVDGHHRLEAFRQLGYDRVPVKYLHSSQLGKTLPNGTYYRSLQELKDAAMLCK